MRQATPILLAAVITSMNLAGCSVFRPIVVSLSNTDQTGRSAPALESTSWVPPEGPAEGLADDAWRLLVFFDPL